MSVIQSYIDKDHAVTLRQFNILLASIGYNFHYERDGWLIWTIENRPDSPQSGAWPAILARLKPKHFVAGAYDGELVYRRAEVADAIQYVTGEGPFEVVHRITAVLEEQ